MKVYFVAAILAAATFVQAQSAASVQQTACGPSDVRFSVDLDKAQHTAAPADPQRARVYFIQDLGAGNSFGMPAQITKAGMDGEWVGANQNNSWFSVSVEPGLHQVCVTAQSRMAGPVVELAHFTAEAGQEYYFRIRNFMWQTQRLELGQPDKDQALYMISSYPLSVSHSKK
jgi:hypothetical protein